MKYYYFEVVTEYEGLDFIDKAIVGFPKEPTTKDWNKQIRDFKHDQTNENLYIARQWEITKKDYEVLKKYL